MSRQVAARAASQTGISADLLKQMLPLVAALTMGALAQRSGGRAGGAPAPGGGGFGLPLPGGRAGANAGAGGSITDLIGSMLDVDRDGSMMDDVVGMLGKMLR